MLKKALLITAALILGLATLPGGGGNNSTAGGLLLNSDSATGSDFKVQ